MQSRDNYDLKDVKLPRLSGTVLRLFANLIETPLIRSPVINRLLNEAGITKLRELTIEEDPTPRPNASSPLYSFESLSSKKSHALIAELLGSITEEQRNIPFTTVLDYQKAYRSGSITPEEVALRVLESIADSDTGATPLRAFISCKRDDVLDQAIASANRIREGKPLSVLDGVPVAIKDEIDQTPYGTTLGTSFLGKNPSSQDATVVARMRAAGALLIGKTGMHEIGIGVTGLNPHHGTTRNPYNLDHYTGGSSSGSAAAVAAGFCPIAIGADGGGSIRIPAALCGIIGLKATYGRISVCGAAPLDWSVGHLGPLAAGAIDLAIAYATIAGPDPKDPLSFHQPPVSLERFQSPDLEGITLGVYSPWFEHSASPVLEACNGMLETLKSLGAKVREIEIPDLDTLRIAHLVTISSEMAACMERYYRSHRRDFGLDVRTNLALARSFKASDYIQAQRIRTKILADFARVLEKVDLIVTPSTGRTAPPIPLNALPNGESDLSTTTELMRFAAAANFTGLPAITFPAGYDKQGLPIGFQVIGKPWREDILLRLANAAEKNTEHRVPHGYYRILRDPGQQNQPAE